MTIKPLATIAAACFILSGCGGNSGSSSASNALAADPGGIWTGTDSATGLQVTALIAESGQMQAIRSDGVQFFGTLTVNGNSISSAIEGDAEFGATFPDGSTHGTGNITGSLSERSAIQASVAFTTDRGESSTSNVTFTFQSSYLTVPNVATIAGTYTDSATGLVITVSSGGALFAQDPATGCVINGRINVVSGAYSLYATVIDYANCTGSLGALNGLQFDGLSTFNGSTSLIGLLDKSGNHYGFVLSLSK